MLRLNKTCLKDADKYSNDIVLPDKLYFYYFLSKHEKVIEIAQQMEKEHYSLNENELFILLDSFIKCNRVKEGQNFIYQNEIEVYDDVYGH